MYGCVEQEIILYHQPYRIYSRLKYMILFSFIELELEPNENFFVYLVQGHSCGTI